VRTDDGGDRKRIPYEIPAAPDLPERVNSVLRVVYLVFNEGYTASRGPALMRDDLASEAIRLGRLLAQMLSEPEVMGLLALMLLHDSRRAARASPSGELIVLDEQDRSLWNRAQIEEGSQWVERALALRRLGPYTLQAAIAAIHCRAERPSDTDWNEIVALYDLLQRVEPSPVVELNRAVAIAMRDGAAAGLALVDALLADRQLSDYRLAHAVRADLCRRLGRVAEARAAYEQTLALTQQEAERQFLQRRLAELSHVGAAPPAPESPASA
jgi:RNA polymerase sigma-70 factor, ECF subfamily